jgi:hypothetical protein
MFEVKKVDKDNGHGLIKRCFIQIISVVNHHNHEVLDRNSELYLIKWHLFSTFITYASLTLVCVVLLSL